LFVSLSSCFAVSLLIPGIPPIPGTLILDDEGKPVVIPEDLNAFPPGSPPQIASMVLPTGSNTGDNSRPGTLTPQVPPSQPGAMTFAPDSDYPKGKFFVSRMIRKLELTGT